MRLHDQDRVGKWGRARIFFSLFKYIFSIFFVISIFSNFFHYAKMVGNRFTEMVFFVGRPLNLLYGIIPIFRRDRVRRLSTNVLSFIFYVFCVGVPVLCMPGVPASSRTFLSVSIRMLPVCCLYVLVCDSYVFVCHRCVPVCNRMSLVCGRMLLVFSRVVL